eukprot:CAMPEP_0202861732 /NCGR_PEP_ID=MMETSP1391-20130828/3034_1 /ASSEMBLY_ACC=CAM_ASM_000867 /TAXON_ID=1034604 /ORGANISM="Chlamydomonas leiostraca, Strain SAG 11-49" /LENGTH=163 /DNA_ID=CAMNT_0049541163 /DNA_START=23 /DNA_END=514 /DNA_ORIENTATION=-
MSATMLRTSAKPVATSSRRASVKCSAMMSQSARSAASLCSIAAAGLIAAAPAMAASVDFASIPKGPVESPLHLDFKVDGYKVQPAAEGLAAGTGHFHVLIDQGAAPEGEVLPFDSTHLHYGKGQTSGDIELAPGEHKLTLQFANALHESYGPQLAKTIVVKVK